MGTVLAVDLAARYSAACLMDDNYAIKYQFDSWGVSEDDFVYSLVDVFHCGVTGSAEPEVIVVEDLPHGLKYSTLIKDVCRLQGRIAQALHEAADVDLDDMLFVAPATWRAHFKGLERGTGSEAVVPVAAGLGYQPPMDTLIARGKGNGGLTRAKKVATDYCSANLIARWAIDMKNEFGTYDVPGTSRYNTNVIRKKEFNAKNSNG